MKKTLTTGLMMVLSAAVLSACGSSGALNAAGLGGSDNAFSQLSLENSDSTATGKGLGYKKQGPMGFQKGFQGPGPGFAFGFLGDLNLTDAQKTEIQSIMEAAKANQPERPTAAERPTPPDATAIRAAHDAIQNKISAAFVSDSFDADALHAEMKSLHPEPNPRPDPAAMELAHAQQTLDLWNVLTAEQKTTVTTKSAEFASKMAAMEAQRPEKANKRPEQGLALFTEKLSLTADQQAALTAAFEANRPAAPAKPDPQALITLLNSGSATAESIAALHTRPQQLDHNPLKPLAALHSILTAEQRQTFVDSGLLKQPGPGGPGGPGRHAGPGGHPGAGPKGHFGGPGGHPMMGQRPGMGERPDFPADAR